MKTCWKRAKNPFEKSARIRGFRENVLKGSPVTMHDMGGLGNIVIGDGSALHLHLQDQPGKACSGMKAASIHLVLSYLMPSI